MKSMKEATYMQRLIVAEIFSIIVVPIIYVILLVFFAPDGYRGKPLSANEMSQFDLLVPKYLMDRAGSSVNLLNMSANKHLTDIISYFEEYLLRFTLQAMVMICLFQFSIDQ